MILYMNPDNFQVFNKTDWYKFYVQMNNTPNLKWIDGIERPYSGQQINRDVWRYTYRYTLNDKPHTFHILKITK